jgi:hypothetical protein
LVEAIHALVPVSIWERGEAAGLEKERLLYAAVLDSMAKETPFCAAVPAWTAKERQFYVVVVPVWMGRVKVILAAVLLSMAMDSTPRVNVATHGTVCRDNRT